MLDATGTWRAALPLRVPVETTLEGTLRKPRECDIPQKSIRVFDFESVALSFLFSSRVMILLRVGAACSVNFGTKIIQMGDGYSLHSLRYLIPRPVDRHSFVPAVVIHTMRMVSTSRLQIRFALLA
jgi:hypothetical protein